MNRLEPSFSSWRDEEEDEHLRRGQMFVFQTEETEEGAGVRGRPPAEPTASRERDQKVRWQRRH